MVTSCGGGPRWIFMQQKRLDDAFLCPDLVLMQGVQIWGQSLILLLHDRRD